MTKILLNDLVPEFDFCTTRNGQQNFKQFKGQTIILYFYPKDQTPGCTCQAEDFKKNYNLFQKLNIEILGVSRDSINSHQKFIEKFQLPFDLISDPQEELCQLFDVIKPKNMYGKMVRGIERSTFLIDQAGRLVGEWRKVKAEGHVDFILKAIALKEDRHFLPV